MKPIFINDVKFDDRGTLGFLELSKEEQICKAIYEATGDLTFKGFLPFTWNTAQVTKMEDAKQRLSAAGKLSVLNMQMALPSISAAAHQYFLSNADKIKPLLPTPEELFKKLTPVLWIAGIAAAGYLISKITPFIPKGKPK